MWGHFLTPYIKGGKSGGPPYSKEGGGGGPGAGVLFSSIGQIMETNRD